MKTTVRPFNLNTAQSGAPVVTRSGCPVRIICFDAMGQRPIIALVKTSDCIERVEEYREDGRLISDQISSVLDLCITEE
ncbi:hypothetical protein [uncultured Rikenella sp.]|uniref:hypothetical protein n=1 Tax=uncultured Rikenella sp. TaxID=368003 RepID=UPI0026118B03|nr:hypothetical protein [uncultured Rikenella sp.]